MAEEAGAAVSGLELPKPFLPKSGIVLFRMESSLFAEIAAIINFYFCRSTEAYLQLDTEPYRYLVSVVQDELNFRDITQRILNGQKALFEQVLSDTEFGKENLRLRAVRPHREGSGQEAIDWHRENMYGPVGNYNVNVWVPISNVTMDTAMQIVPDSHLIPDSQLVTQDVEDVSCARGSPGHYIGLLDKAKHIIGGVDFHRARPLVVNPGEAAIFSGNMIHGAGHNRSNNIRFSFDFRAVGSKVLNALQAQGEKCLAPNGQ